MHLVLRSGLAYGAWSLRHGNNPAKIDGILRRFAARHGIWVLNLAIQGNHIHLYVQLTSGRGYRRFIRAVTGAIALAVLRGRKLGHRRFWARRPFSRIILGGPAAEDRVHRYVEINKLEAAGLTRKQAREHLGAAENWHRKSLRCSASSKPG
jgi:REP element-mobilizing transposase RayT